MDRDIDKNKHGASESIGQRPKPWLGEYDASKSSGSLSKMLAKRRARKSHAEVRIVGSIDYALLLVVTLLVLFGVVMVFSASYATAGLRFNDPYHFATNTIVFAAVGFVIMWILTNVTYEFYRPWTWVLYVVSIGLLILVIFIGEDGGGATRWLQIPVIGNFQPSEIARAAIIFMMAYMIERYPLLLKNWFGIAFLGMIVGLVAGLIALPGGFTVALITSVIGLAIIAISSSLFWKLVAVGGIAAGGLAAYLWFQYITQADFRGNRVGVWLDPFSDPLGGGYQTIQSLFAIASGGWFGLGLGNSRQASFVPEPHNDIIFSIAVEELGFLGAFLILVFFSVFIWRGIITSMRAPDTYSSIIALGIVFAIGLQVVINIGVVTNTIPNTGVNLPFISYGGTSLVVSMALVGVLLNISRYTKQKPK